MSDNGKFRSATSRWLFVGGWLIILAISLYVRSAGLFRGLEDAHIYHPDEPKQVFALHDFMSGRYVRYLDSPFYDGYPYALNHVDEWILRPVLAATFAVQRHLGLSAPLDSAYPAKSFFFLSRALRVVYGLICVWLTYLVARQLSLSRLASSSAALLLALSPLSVAVCHFASGDIGPDLFTGVGLLLLCRYALTQRRYFLLLAGAATGAAFACKYNGALGGLSIAFFVCLSALANRSVRSFVWGGLISGFGFMIGAIVMTPAFFINPKKTLDDIIINFRFIQEYGASAEFLAKPLFQKVWLSWGWHAPRIGIAVGVALLLLALIGCVTAGTRYLLRKRLPIEADFHGHLRLCLSLFIYPFVSIAISLTAKSEVQPFHFSYLQLPLVIAAVYGAVSLWATARIFPRVLCLSLSVWMFLNAAHRIGDEVFFWKRDDAQAIRCRVLSDLFRSTVTSADVASIKSIALEPENPSVFRNRYRDLPGPRASFWRNVQVLPFPCVPYPDPFDWILANGPVFPRNDRLLYVPPLSTVRKALVLSGNESPVTLGIRTGHLPVSLRLEIGELSKRITLGPERWELVTMSPRQWRQLKFKDGSGECLSILSLRLRSEMGQAWVSVMTTEAERLRFQVFCGEHDVCPPELTTTALLPELEARLQETRFVDQDCRGDVFLNAAHADMQEHILDLDGIALDAGQYVLECEFSEIAPETEVVLRIDDLYSAAKGGDRVVCAKLDDTTRRIRLVFEKAVTPYECLPKLFCTQGACALISWELRPDYAASISSIRSWAAGGIKPDWLQFGAAKRSPAFPLGGPVHFGRAFDVVDFEMPGSIQNNEPLQVYCSADVHWPAPRHIQEYVLFLHLHDKEGRQVYSDGVPLWRVLSNRARGVPLVLNTPKGLSTGPHSVRIGICNERTRKRLSCNYKDISSREKRKRCVKLGTVQVIDDTNGSK